MTARLIVISPEAKADLFDLYDWIADAASPETAAAYLDRVVAFLGGFDVAPERGTLRDDIRPGLRTVGFERRLTVAFTVSLSQVTILRVFYGGRNWPDALSET